jgi:hypothetical protein
MQVSEFQKKSLFTTKYGLGLTLTLSAEQTIETEFRHIKESVLKWYGNRGKKAELLMLTISSSRDKHPHLEHFIDKVYRHESELSPILQMMEVQVALLDEKGKEAKKYKLSKK